jgi:hypothetical protein
MSTQYVESWFTELLLDPTSFNRVCFSKGHRLPGGPLKRGLRMHAYSFLNRAKYLRLLVALAALATIVTLGLNTPASAMPPIYPLGHPPPPTSPSNTLTSVSCPTSSFCAAVDEEGNVWENTSGTWTMQVADPGNEVYSISCTSSSFCVAVDNVGNALIYDSSTWSTNNIDSTTPINTVSCASSIFCVAVDNTGDALIFNGTNWSSGNIAGGSVLFGISCVSSSFCVATTNGGEVYIYNGSTWTGPNDIDSGQSLNSVSCTSTIFCMAVDNAANAWTYNGTSWAWQDTGESDSDAFESVSCSSSSFCTAVDFDGNALTFNGTSWSSTDADGSAILTAVSCTSSTNCAAGDDAGDYLSYNGTNWSSDSLNINSNINAVSCTSAPFCAVVDQQGALAYSSGAEPFGSGLTIPVKMGIGALDGISCTSSSWCMTVSSGSGGKAALWEGGSSAAATYTAVLAGVVDGVSCYDSDLCMAVSKNGKAYYFNGTSWAVSNGGSELTTGKLFSIECYSASCAALSEGGTVYTCSSCGSGAWGSSYSIAAPWSGGAGSTSLACPDTGLTCLEVPSSTSTVYETTDGWVGHSSGSLNSGLNTSTLASVSCLNGNSNLVCAAINTNDNSSGDNVFWSSNGWTTSGSQGGTGQNPDTDQTPNNISCYGSEECVVVWQGGYVTTGNLSSYTRAMPFVSN